MTIETEKTDNNDKVSKEVTTSVKYFKFLSLSNQNGKIWENSK